MDDLVIKGLHVSAGGKEILKGIDLTIKEGEFHALMGPNGSGKSTLSYAIMGHPDYTVTSGSITYQGHDVLSMAVNERAQLGIFLSFQHPEAIPGVPVESFLRTAINTIREKKLSVLEFRELLQKKGELLKIPEGFTKRYLNEGFSGGERKKTEILQLSVLEPTLALLDETDSGLDVDALKVVANGVNTVKKENPEMSVLIITHYQRILNYIKPDRIHIMYDGKLVKTGGPELIDEIEKNGYEKFVSPKS